MAGTLWMECMSVVSVPGDGGSQLFAKLNRSGVPHWYCYKDTQDFFNIWLNLEEIAFSIDCFVENMMLVSPFLTFLLAV